MIFFTPPALAQAPRPSTKPADTLAEALESVPEALADRHPSRVPTTKAKALAVWENYRQPVLQALLEADRSAFEKTMNHLRSVSGDSAGLAALDAMEILEHRLPEGRPRWLAAADRQGMRAWILLGQGRADLPDLAEAFRPLLDHDGGAHAQAVTRVRVELARFQEANGRHSIQEAQKAASTLLNLVDAFEK